MGSHRQISHVVVRNMPEATRQARARVEAHYEARRKIEPTLVPWRKLTASQKRAQYERTEPGYQVNNHELGIALRRQ